MDFNTTPNDPNDETYPETVPADSTVDDATVIDGSAESVVDDSGDASGSEVETDAPDPTGGTPEQIAAKQAVNHLGDLDAVNMAPNPAGPSEAEVIALIASGDDLALARAVRRYPDNFPSSIVEALSHPEPDNDDDGDDGDDDSDAELVVE